MITSWLSVEQLIVSQFGFAAFLFVVVFGFAFYRWIAEQKLLRAEARFLNARSFRDIDRDRNVNFAIVDREAFECDQFTDFWFEGRPEADLIRRLRRDERRSRA